MTERAQEVKDDEIEVRVPESLTERDLLARSTAGPGDGGERHAR